MTIRKFGSAEDQKVNTEEDPGEGQGVRKEASSNVRMGDLTDAERERIVRGEE